VSGIIRSWEYYLCCAMWEKELPEPWFIFCRSTNQKILYKESLQYCNYDVTALQCGRINFRTLVWLQAVMKNVYKQNHEYLLYFVFACLLETIIPSLTLNHKLLQIMCFSILKFKISTLFYGLLWRSFFWYFIRNLREKTHIYVFVRPQSTK
jgi:hypothetical protein